MSIAEKYKNLEIINRREKDILSSKDSIYFFQRNIMDLQSKNQASIKFIREQEEILNLLKSAFLEKNKISFEDASKLIQSTYCPEKKYNLNEFNNIDEIIQNINSEKFFINYRNIIIEKNKNFINDSTKWIMSLEKELEKIKN